MNDIDKEPYGIVLGCRFCASGHCGLRRIIENFSGYWKFCASCLV